MSWIKKELNYIKDSIPQIAKGFLLFLLVSSGLGVAILLNYLDQNGTIIAFLSFVVELISLIASYFLVRKYFTEKEEDSKEQKKRVK